VDSTEVFEFLEYTLRRLVGPFRRSAPSLWIPSFRKVWGGWG
jgi:hypothetical protein